MFPAMDPKQKAREPELREALADYAHTAWSDWMEYLSSKIREGSGCEKKSGYWQEGWLPSALLDRWKRQMATGYFELPESEKERDRFEADKILKIFETKMKRWILEDEPKEGENVTAQD